MTSLTVKERALELARQGLAVFPCHDAPGTAKDKIPCHRGGFHNATNDPEWVSGWVWEGRLIGVPTGPVNGFAALDIDPPDGDVWLRANLNRLSRQGIPRSHRTQSGGLHLLFKVTDDTVRNSASKIAPGVDVRGHGGSIIWWPAHPERGGCVLDDVPLSELPPWPDWLVPEPKVNPLHHGGGGKWRAGASPGFVNYLADRMRNEREGNRNDLLFWCICKINERKFERQSQLDRALGRLYDAAVAAGLEPDKAAATIESGMRPERRRGG